MAKVIRRNRFKSIAEIPPRNKESSDSEKMPTRSGHREIKSLMSLDTKANLKEPVRFRSPFRARLISARNRQKLETFHLKSATLRKDKKAARFLFTMVLTFGICWVFFFVLML